jgi:hypothetical protein
MTAQGFGRGGKCVSSKVEKADSSAKNGGSHQVPVVGHEDEHQEEANKDLGHVEQCASESLLVR